MAMATVHLHCSNNNRAETVLHCFEGAVYRYGLPTRVRSDQGTENRLVALYMLRNRGIDRSSIITGASTHNQRIERLWYDMHRCITVLYYRLFYFMEQQGILDPLDNLQVFCLHYIYLPRINRTLEMFREGWNSHGIRTAGHHSPHQLFTQGVLSLHASGLTALDFLDTVDESYGINETFLGVDDGNEGIVVPETRIHVSDHLIQQLQQEVDPLSISDNNAIELYERALKILTLTEFGDSYIMVVSFLQQHRKG